MRGLSRGNLITLPDLQLRTLHVNPLSPDALLGPWVHDEDDQLLTALSATRVMAIPSRTVESAVGGSGTQRGEGCLAKLLVDGLTAEDG